jgi:hypothetical protein
VRISDALAEPQIPLLVARDCRWLVEALGAVAADRQHPDVYDERSVYCHTLDALRYYFVNRPRVRQEFHEVHHEYRSPFPWPVPGDGNAVLPYDQPRPLQQRSGPIW